MKKFLIFLIVVIGLFVGSQVLAAEKITDFKVEIEINQDSSINVKETIKYDFDDLQKHGIFRWIPVKYKARGGNYNLRISDIFVTDENNQHYNVEISYPGDYVQLKIGDPDVFITGRQIYNIKYRIKRAINYFDDYDELYWNATGNNWSVPIDYAQVNVKLPQAIKNVSSTCFAGETGSNKVCQNRELIKNNKDLISEIQFEQSDLQPNQGLTVVVGVPKGILQEPVFLENIKYTLFDNWVLLIPLLVFSFCFYFWYTRGRDPEGRGTIIAQFDPPDNLSPAEVGTIYDNKMQGKDISAEIINLAIKGYLKIKQIEEKGFFKSANYDFIKLKESDNKLTEIQQNLMNHLFDYGTQNKVKLSQLRNKFHADFALIRDKIWDNLIKEKYFPKNYRSAGTIFTILGVLLIFISISSVALFITYLGLYWFFSLIFSGLIILMFGVFMPKITKKGAITKEYILGLKQYLTVAEKDRLKFHNAPEKNPQEFERLLPYAMVLGVENQWAEQFKDIYKEEQPNWYSAPASQTFSAFVLVDSLKDFKSVSASSLSSSPSSSGAAGGSSGFSGGGFSGGGFGGGGGGSW
jgi:uncharacterized membrane protein